jgi:transposase
MEMVMRDLDSLVSEDHPVRAIWDFLQRLDLSAFYAWIKAVGDQPGRPASDPEVLLAVWLYATAEGVGSARRLEGLCQEHDAYRWLCGGVPVNYHTLSDFRVAHQGALEQLLTDILAAMMAEDLVQLKQVAQDGMRVRTSAGAGSFRRQDRLQQCLAEAEAQVQRLAQEREHPDPEVSRREEAARERAAQERRERVQGALRQLPAVQRTKERLKRTKAKSERKKVTEPRVSTTDPDARVMKMADGGYRPAYNVQLATDVASGMIVGVTVLNQGNDAGQAPPLEAQVAQRTGSHPGAYLIDGGYAQRETITDLADRQVTVYAPVRPPRTTTSERERSTPRSDDSPAVVAWRQRMETEEAKRLYKLRAATAEWANAQARGHGLLPFTVRGLGKVLSVVLLVTIAHNLLRWRAVGA